MKILAVTAGILAILVSVSFYPSRQTTPEQKIAGMLCIEVNSFDSLVGAPFMYAVRRGDGQTELQRLFFATRLAYKRWEWAAEYFNPGLARRMNGEPVPEADMLVTADPAPGDPITGRFMVTDPEGLQVIEGLLFPHYDTASKQLLLNRLASLREIARQYETRFKNVGILSGQVFDAAKLEVFRILTLGITGFDDALSQHSMEECAAALDGVRAALSQYSAVSDSLPASQASFDGLVRLLIMAAADLRGHAGFNSFDRASFIVRYGNPLSKAISHLASEWKIPVIRYNRLLRQDATTLFDRDAFNADAYIPEGSHPTTDALVQLGRRLFFEPALSGSGTRSCATCHQPNRAFADGLLRNTSLDGHGLLTRNTPTLLNAALQPALFYDLRAATLEDQLQDVLHNSIEMKGSLYGAVLLLDRDSGYRRLFAAAFPGSPQATTDTLRIITALAAYVRSLVRLDSRFDEYMRGDSTAMDAEERKGFNLFMGKARCGTCHYMPLFNGNFPPMYNRIEGEVIGVPAARGVAVIDGDPGQFAIVPAPFLQHAFKTPTIRNAAGTAPYMHNGVFESLIQVVDFYNDGGGAGEGAAVPNQTLAVDSLHLDTLEEKALVRFIESLNSK
jgi:cytochrome c peroxidase